MSSTNLSMRVDVELLERLDAAAQRAGITRTAYILSWLPEHHDSNASTSAEQPAAVAR